MAVVASFNRLVAYRINHNPLAVFFSRGDQVRSALGLPIYFISMEERESGPIKIGRTNNIEKRMRDLQTGNPETLNLLGYIHSNDDKALERGLHQQFQGQRREKGEWFEIDVNDILPCLRGAGRKGFAASAHAVYEFAGNDRDGLPEFVRGAAWLMDLEPQECCPCCGCFCGMWYSEAHGYEICQQCGYSGLEPDHSEEEWMEAN